MKKQTSFILGLKFYPLTPRRWKDFEELFGERGACGGCWCMWWRLARSQFEKQKGNKNKLAMRKLVNSGQVPGILAYVGNKPIGWCSIGPREIYLSLIGSRFLKTILEEKGDEPIWSITCFFVDKNFRNQGLSIKLIEAAVEFARKKGAKLVEAYPKQPKKDKWPDAFVWTGHISAFKKCGFVETHRPSPSRPIMRYFIQKTK
ncbi:MAG: GNAT family N-acetyltransferase [candidate division Zixibacteria bacterium]|nr:GNAT family N-acetyltransferase [candidate division Zixibacteria bacterium]